MNTARIGHHMQWAAVSKVINSLILLDLAPPGGHQQLSGQLDPAGRMDHQAITGWNFHAYIE
jgi:hypothetical protein